MSDPTGVDVLARLVPTLAFIVGGLLALRWWAKRTRAGAGGGVRVLARSGLARGAMVAVVEVGSRRFLVGGGDHSVSLLAELDPDDTTAQETVAAPATIPTSGPRDGLEPARPWSGLIDRLRATTVRTHVERPLDVDRR